MANVATDLLTTMVKEDLPGGGWRADLSGERYMRPIVRGVIEMYPEHFQVRPLAAVGPGEKVTLLRTYEGTFGTLGIDAVEGTMFDTDRGPAILPKGRRKNGYLVKNVLDVATGYGHTAMFRSRIELLRAAYPQLVKATQHDLETIDRRSSVCDLALFGEWFGGPGIYFAHTYDAEDDIVEGMLCIHPRYGESEHGSIYGQQLLDCAAVVIGFGEVPFDQAITLDYHGALALVTR